MRTGDHSDNVDDDDDDDDDDEGEDCTRTSAPSGNEVSVRQQNF